MNDSPVRAAFLMSDAETVALAAYASAPDWRGRPGGGTWTFALAAVGLFPAIAAASVSPFDPRAAAYVGGVGSVFTAPLLAAAIFVRRGGPWLDAIRRRRVERTAAKHAAAYGLATHPQAVSLDELGATGEAGGRGGSAWWRSWTRCRHVDVVPVPVPPAPNHGEPGDAEPGELLVVAAALGGPAPVALALPRRAAEDAGLTLRGGRPPLRRVAGRRRPRRPAPRRADPLPPAAGRPGRRLRPHAARSTRSSAPTADRPPRRRRGGRWWRPSPPASPARRCSTRRAC